MSVVSMAELSIVCVCRHFSSVLSIPNNPVPNAGGSFKSWTPPPSRSETPPLPLPKRGQGCPCGSGKAKGSVEVKISTSKKAEPASKKMAASPAKLEEAKCSEHKFFLTFHDVPLTTFLDGILYVPRALSDNARKRVAISKSDNFEMMCHIVYATLECQDALMKPKLAFKLPNTTKSSSATCLQTEEEW